ncbi:FkbM family methyltransferase [Spirosoma sp.]|uniref:FkbM family methyltransferase n=1 Tax=Spirosoma sp. TaxID=1899569 RepID=UPI002615DFF9|nr:FkbM family methyltransferase [Spirosoma sp.]MCX6213640.1 FkbM family methyltransferase [Spirosoma sp.]
MKQALLNTVSTALDKLGFDGDRVLFKTAILAHKLGLKEPIDNSKPYNFGDFSMYVDPHDTLQIINSGKFEETETQTILSFVKANTVMLDIGANMGFYSIRVGQKAVHGKVFAFEPDPGNYATLQKNLVLNNLTNVTAYNAALSDKKETLRLYKHPFNVGDYRLYNDGDFTEYVDVPTLRLDDTIKERVDLIKIDVQGFEYFVLKGGQALLAKYMPIVISEFWPRGLYNSGASPADYLSMMQDLGYGVSQIDEEKNEVVTTTYDALFDLGKKPVNRYINLVFQASV